MTIIQENVSTLRISEDESRIAFHLKGSEPLVVLMNSNYHEYQETYNLPYGSFEFDFYNNHLDIAYNGDLVRCENDDCQTLLNGGVTSIHHRHHLKDNLLYSYQDDVIMQYNYFSDNEVESFVAHDSNIIFKHDNEYFAFGSFKSESLFDDLSCNDMSDEPCSFNLDSEKMDLLHITPNALTFKYDDTYYHYNIQTDQITTIHGLPHQFTIGKTNFIDVSFINYSDDSIKMKGSMALRSALLSFMDYDVNIFLTQVISDGKVFMHEVDGSLSLYMIENGEYKVFKGAAFATHGDHVGVIDMIPLNRVMAILKAEGYKGYNEMNLDNTPDILSFGALLRGNTIHAFVGYKNGSLYHIDDDQSGHIDISSIQNVEAEKFYSYDDGLIMKVRGINQYYCIGIDSNVCNADDVMPPINAIEVCLEDNLSCKAATLSFTSIGNDVIIRDIYASKERLYAISESNQLYGTGMNTFKTISTSGGVRYRSWLRINYDPFKDLPICKVFPTESSPVYIETCHRQLYTLGYEIDQYFKPHEGSFQKTSDAPSRLFNASYHDIIYKDIISMNHMTIFITKERPICHQLNDCEEESDIIIEGEVIDLNNVNTIETNMTFINSTIVVNTPPGGNGVPIIVNGGKLSIKSTKITYKIDSKEVFDSIKDGDEIIVIEAINGGIIEGEFSEVTIEYAQEEEECKIIKAKSKEEGGNMGVRMKA